MPAAYINMNGNTSGVLSDGKYYNALDLTGSIADARNDTDSGNTGWTIAVTGDFSQTGSTGSTYGGLEFANEAMQTQCWLRTTSGTTAQITITGLNDAAAYDLTFGCMSGIPARSTIITIGASSISIVGSGSDEERVGSITGVVPSDGTIVIDFSQGAEAPELEISFFSAFKIVENTAAPVISGGTPTGTVTANPVLGFTTNTASGTARIVVDSAGNLAGVTAGQVLAGQKANGTAAAYDTGNITVSSTTVSSTAISGLPAGNYTAAAAQSQGGNSNVLTWTFTVDDTAPSFSDGPNATSVTDTGMTITGTASENCTASLIVTSQAASQPSNAAFDNSTETASATTGVPFSIPHTGDTPGQGRKAWVQLKDGAGNRTTASVNYTTLSRSVTLQLTGPGVANKNLRVWTRQTNDGSAVDGGGSGLNVTTDGNGNLVLTGLTVPAGAGRVDVVDPTDTFNAHIYYVTFE